MDSRRESGDCPVSGQPQSALPFTRGDGRADGRRWRSLLPRLACGYPAAVVVLAAHFLIAVASVREKSDTFDEPAHIMGGYSYWTRNDYRLQPDNGNLPQRWLALPLLTLDLKFPEDRVAWMASDLWTIGDRSSSSGETIWRRCCGGAVHERHPVGGLGTSRLRVVAEVVRTRRGNDLLVGLCDQPRRFWPTGAWPPPTWRRRRSSPLRSAACGRCSTS